MDLKRIYEVGTSIRKLTYIFQLFLLGGAIALFIAFELNIAFIFILTAVLHSVWDVIMYIIFVNFTDIDQLIVSEESISEPFRTAYKTKYKSINEGIDEITKFYIRVQHEAVFFIGIFLLILIPTILYNIFWSDK